MSDHPTTGPLPDLPDDGPGPDEVPPPTPDLAAPVPLPGPVEPRDGVTPGGWPYVRPDDHPLQYPAVSQALATKLDTSVAAMANSIAFLRQRRTLMVSPTRDANWQLESGWWWEDDWASIPIPPGNPVEANPGFLCVVSADVWEFPALQIFHAFHGGATYRRVRNAGTPGAWGAWRTP